MSIRLASAVAAVAMSTSAALAASDDRLTTNAGEVAIHAIHHAALTLTFNGTTILVDPAPLGQNVDTAEFTALPAPALILITHEHGDHFNVPILQAVSGNATIVAPQSAFDKMPDDLKAKTKVMKNGDKLEVAGVPIEAVPAYNNSTDKQQYHPKGRDNGYVLTFGDKHVYIAGDTEDTPEMRALTGIDVAFLPMNLPYTMSVDQAADAVAAFKPKVVYPYHSRGTDVAAFKTKVGGAADVRILDWYPS
ncbi:MAG TPA: MBL fold metallo-hydrolase [Bauldia sp.]|nr:MBL fold metallo-hydrolase [Bauldia sp.]